MMRWVGIKSITEVSRLSWAYRHSSLSGRFFSFYPSLLANSQRITDLSIDKMDRNIPEAETLSGA